jgi:hypothetical protein
MKQLFTKYFKVAGELHEGDLFLIDNKPSIHKFLGVDKDNSNFAWFRVIEGYDGEAGKEYKAHIVNIQNKPKIKMYLCSRDIKAGDTVFFRVASGAVEKQLRCLESFEEDRIDGGKSITVVLEDGEYKVHTTPDETNQCYVPIGEVSANAYWVKPGDEFNLEDLKRGYKPARFSSMIVGFVPYTVEQIMQEQNYLKKTASGIELHTVYQIMGPCGHFH